MKIAFNPSTVEALIAPPNNKDITFDLRGRNIFARGVKFCGTDTNTWRDIKINNVSIGSNTLDLRNGSNTTLTNINGIVTINSTQRPVVDNLTSDSTTSSLSANQGRVLKALIDGKSDSEHNHDDRYLRLTGGWMSGDVNFGGDNKIYWGRNTDSASISFKNDGDGDADSYMSFVTSDNGNEYFRWSHSSGSTNTEWMSLRSDGLRVGGTKVSLEGHSHNDLYYTKTEVNNKLNDKSDTSHTHDDRYLKLTGGTISGTIYRNSGGATISGRDHAIIRQTYAPGGSSWNPIACVDTETGTWTLGHLSSGDSDTNFHFCFSTNTDYNAGNNNGNYVTLRNKVGTIALLSEIPDKNSWNYDDRYIKKSGDTMIGALNFANGTWNLVGDDSYMGDCNISGHFGIKAANTTYPGISFFNNTNSHLGNLTAYNSNIKYGAYSLQFLDNGNTSVSASTWMNPFSGYNSNAVADGQAICVWGQSSSLSNLAADSGDMSLWLKRVNANVATLNMVLDGEYYANGNQRLAHVSEIPTSLKNPYALTISLNGTSQGPYDGSAAKNINITPSSIGAATSDHNHINYLSANGLISGNIDNIWTHGTYGFGNRSSYTGALPGNSSYGGFLVLNPNATTTGAYYTTQIALLPGYFGYRIYDDNKWYDWKEVSMVGHNHDERYVRYYAVTTLDCNNLAVGLTAARVSATNAAHTNHSAYLYISDVGTPFQIQIPDSSVPYIYKRYYSSGTWSGWFKLNAGYADSAGSASNADTVDGYHASSLWRSDGGIWNPGANISLTASGNNQEWSFDIRRNGYTGCYWHVWDSDRSTMLKVNADNGKVYAPYNFVGNLEGNATTSTKSEYSRSLLGRSTSGNDYDTNSANLVFAEWNTMSDNRWYLKATGYECRVAYANNASRVYGQVGDTGSHELVRCDMNNDQFRIIAGSNGNNNGWAEIATADDGNEPIYVRQYTGVFSSVRRTLTLLDGSGNTIFPGSLSIGGQIIREGHSAMWIYGRDVALLRETTAPGYHTLWSLKTTNGSWDFGEYNTSGWNNVPVLSYITDSNYNSGNNATTYQIKFPLASGTVALTSYGGDSSHPIFLGYLDLNHGNDGTISSSFYCLGYSVPFTYTRGGNYCRISIPDTTHQVFYIKAAIASVNYSGGGMDTWVGDHRGDGAWWLHCYASGSNEVRVKGFCQRNSNNDSWWGGNPLWSGNSGANRITVCIFGYVTFR